MTVGTTRFDALVAAVLSPAFADALVTRRGLKRLVVQVGNSALPPDTLDAVRRAMEAPAAVSSPSSSRSSRTAPTGTADSATDATPGWPLPDAAAPVSFSWHHGLHVSLYRLKPSIADDLAGAAFVVSHAGAGSIFEALAAGAPPLVVVNPALADNHQVELAEAMTAWGHLDWCTVDRLADAASRWQPEKAVPLPRDAGVAAGRAFVAALDGVLGF